MAVTLYKDLPFSIVSAPLPDGGVGRRTVARFVCSSCEQREEVGIGPNLNPEATIKKIVALGWDAHLRKNRVLCPRCLKPAAPKGVAPQPVFPLDIRSAGVRKALDNHHQTPFNHALKKAIDDSLKNELASVMKSNQEKPVSTALPQSTGREAPAASGVAGRLKIRSLLDQYFDDAKGMYLGGYTDKKVADEAGVDVGAVAAIRDAAYGPIMIDPVIAEAMAELSSLRARLEEATSAFEAERKAIVSAINAIEKKLEAA